MYRFKGFTEKANTALNLAVEAAQELGHTYIGTEHIVLGLLREGTGVAASVLGARGVTAAQYLDKIIEAESSGNFSRLTPEDFTPRAKKAMEMALAEASAMQHGYVGTEHVLAAVLHDENSVAVRLLEALGAGRRNCTPTLPRPSAAVHCSLRRRTASAAVKRLRAAAARPLPSTSSAAI